MSKYIVITQPNFIPWLGYFHQLINSEKFIFLDSVQFAKREWQNRNRIIDRNGIIKFLTVPIKKCKQQTSICDIEISDEYEIKNHIQLIRECYKGEKKLNYKIEIIEHIFSEALNKSFRKLNLFNQLIIKAICREAKIKLDCIGSSELEFKINYKTSTERLVELCYNEKCNKYLSSIGAKSYMENELYKFKDKNINVFWHDFFHAPYIDNKNFVPYMSIVDYLIYNDISDLKNYLNRNILESSIKRS